MSRRKRMLQQLDDEIREHIAIETQDNIERAAVLSVRQTKGRAKTSRAGTLNNR
jgi:hypothetical protein